EFEGDKGLEAEVEQPREEPFGFYRIRLGSALRSARARLRLTTGWLRWDITGIVWIMWRLLSHAAPHGWGSQEPKCEYQSDAYLMKNRPPSRDTTELQRTRHHTVQYA